MIESSITTKGQTTLPKPVRDALGVRPGDRVRYLIVDDDVRNPAGAVHRPAVRRAEVRWTRGHARRHGTGHRRGSHRVVIALDTNVLVRYLVDDDAKQAEAARALLDALTPARPGFVCREVMVELVWVLRRTYGHTPERIAAVLEGPGSDRRSRRRGGGRRGPVGHALSPWSRRFLRPDDRRRRGTGRGAPGLHIRPQGRATPGCHVAGCVGIVTQRLSSGFARPGAHAAVS